MKPTATDIFCGAGGSSDGFRRAGFDIILGIDKEPKMLAAFRANHPDTEVWERDVLTIDPSELPDADVIISSPPCQDFSTANVRKDPERGMVLVNWMLGVVEAKKPRYWVMENVPGVRKHLPGWIPTIKVLNAVEYGVPQTRKRCFAGDYPVPAPTHNNGPSPQPTLDGKTLKPWVTVRDAIWDLIASGGGRRLTSEQMEKINKHRRKVGLRGAPDPLDEPSRTVMASEAKSTEKNIIVQAPSEGFNPDYESELLDPDKPSKTVTPLWRCDHRLPGGRMGRYVVPVLSDETVERIKRSGVGLRVHNPDRPAKTIKRVTGGPQNAEAYLAINLDSPATTIQRDPRLWPRGHHYLRKVVFRRLTVREAARLQSFPDSYKFVGSSSWKFNQVGEAVPPLLAQRIAEEMLRRW